MGAKQLPRGIRNHNPGNIRKSKDQWQGLAAEQADAEFFCFKSAPYGIRALARTLITYQDKRRAPDGSPIDTIAEIIDRWAPAVENDTAAYVRHVDKLHPKAAIDTLDLHDYEDLKPLVVAIIAHENAGYRYTDAEIDKGLALAGVEPAKPQSLQKSRTVKGAQAATVATIAGGVAEAVRQAEPAIPLLQSALEYAPWVVAVIALAGLGYVVYAKWDDRRRGIA